MTLFHSLAKRKVQHKELWRLLLPPLVRMLSEGSFNLRELGTLTHNLYIVRMQSPKLYDIIVDYFVNKKGFTDKDLANLGARSAVNFLHAIAFCHGDLNNEDFFTVMRRYIMSNIEVFNRF